MSVETGQPAPGVSLPTDGDGHVSLSDLKGKAVVLYFYPKADTSGCTKQAVAFKEAIADFEAAGAVIVGVSKDPVAKLDKFKAKYELPFTLASDAEGDVCERYGVWKEKSMYGKTYMGIERTTVLIDGSGTVRQVWPKVKVPGHAEKVLDAVRALD
jgi:peroxiredoxin